MKENDPETISQKYITDVVTPGFKFILNYAEKLSGDTVEFLHTHPNFEIYYVLENRIQSFVEGTILTLEKGDILFLAPDVKHYTIYEPQIAKEYFVLIFNIALHSHHGRLPSEYESQYAEIMERLDVIRDAGYLVLRRIPYLGGILENIRQEMLRRGIGWNILVNQGFFQFFINAIRQVETAPSLTNEPPEHLNLGLEASKYIHANYHLEITLESVAEYLGITPRHVNRVFRKIFGTTFAKTLSLLRLNYAKKYLLTTDHSIDKISELVGFRTPRTLFKLFNQYEGMTVAEYRARHKNDPRVGVEGKRL